ncbi:MAG: hypothetical protein PSV36_19705 [Algoriphagus sp.]|nr:hypothetical protein [Algoriphagus sp.]
MNRLTPFLTLGLLLLLNACGPNLVEENKKMRAQLIAVHDEVMPQMGKLKSLEKKATQKIEVLSNQEPVDSVQIEKLKVLAFDLNKAYEGMFLWMRQYDTEDGDKKPIEVKAYLEEQMVMVAEVNQEIKDVIERAEMELKD